MPPKKPFSELQWRQRQRIVQTVYEQVAAHCPAVQDVTDLLDAVIAKCQAFLPDLIYLLETRFVLSCRGMSR